MPYGDFVNDLPIGFFVVVHLAALVIALAFAWQTYTRQLSYFSGAFFLYALAEVSYLTYHFDWTVFLFAHTISEVLTLLAVILFFMGLKDRKDVA